MVSRNNSDVMAGAQAALTNLATEISQQLVKAAQVRQTVSPS